jgi:hypothetical protein
MAIQSSRRWTQSSDSDGSRKLPDLSMTPANARESTNPGIPGIERLPEVTPFG